MVVWAALPSDPADCCLRDLAAAEEAAVLPALCAAVTAVSSLVLVADEEVAVAVVAAGWLAPAR